MLGSHVDITDQKHAEEALRESEEKFRNLIDNTLDWVWQVDAAGTYTYISENAENIIGYKHKEILWENTFRFHGYRGSKTCRFAFSQSTERHERIIGLEDIMKHKNGHELVFETNATYQFLMITASLKVISETCRDITDRKMAERSLKEAKLFLENLTDIAYMTDTQGNVAWVNSAVGKIIGLSKERYYRETPFYHCFLRMITTCLSKYIIGH